MSESVGAQHHVAVVRDDQVDPAPQTAPRRSSALASLRARVQEARTQTVLERAPKALDDVVLRFRALSVDEAEEINERRGITDLRSLTPEKGVLASCDVLIKTCVGIFVRHEGQLIPALGLEEAPTLESPELAHDLGVDWEGAKLTDVVKALYPFDADIGTTSAAILKFSGFGDDDRNSEIHKVARGNS